MADDSIAATRRERFARLCTPGGALLMVPMDHGISMGPLPGIAPISDTLAKVADSASCTTVHKGLITEARKFQDRLGILMHLSASTDRSSDPNDKRIIGTVEEAVALGADGVSVHINLGSATEADQLEAVGKVSTDCNRLGLPLIAMVYPRGPAITNPHEPELVAHAARLAQEIGADAVKVPYTGDAKSFSTVTAGVTIPVIVAGGPTADDFLTRVQEAKDAGATGVSIGRNVFQASDPAATMATIADIFA